MRFPEFEGEWERIPLSDLLEFFSTNSLSWEQLEYGGNKIQNLHYGLIHVGLPTLVDTKMNELPTIKSEFLPRNYEVVKEGDVAFADASEDTNEVAKAVEFVEIGDHPIVCGLHTIHGRDRINLTIPGFKGYYLGSPSFHNQIRRLAQGTKIFSISTKILGECFISIPSKTEQKKIAGLLSLIDDRIATQRKIIEDLEKLKSAIYHKVFSTIKGETVALTSVANIVKGKQLNGEELSDSGTYYVMNGGIVPSGYYHEYNTPENTISISEGGNSCGYVQFNHKPFWSGGHCYTLHLSNESVNLLFLYHFLKYKEKDIMALRIGSGLPNIQKRTLGNFPVLLPSINEQNKVVRLFEAIQQKVGIDIKILHQLLIQKQYLLQQMFI
ncbi:restriction endonuclease subunit S [bacterium]|nr:restriction endonuclease subunit S [bacterium]